MRRLDMASGAVATWPGEGGAPSPSADGQEVLFSTDDDRFAIGRADGSVAASVPAAGYLVRPQLSADGQLITASGWLDDGPTGIAVHLFARSGGYLDRGPEGWESSAWLLGIDGTGLRQLTVSSSSESTPAWSPDARYVIVRPAGGCGLQAVPADGERVFVGNASVPSSASTLQMVEDGRTRTVCAFSQPHWR